MSSAAAREAGRPREAPERTWADRLLAAYPLVLAYLALAILFCWEAWKHGTPWLFTDELKYAQLSRGIAQTGHALQRGAPQPFDSLYSYWIAPAWLIHDTATAYAAVRYLGALTMAAALFPAYGLARTVASPRASLFAAVATAAIPSVAYSSLLVTEPLAYPVSTLALFLMVRALADRTRGWVAGAVVVAAIVAPLVRGELAVLPAALALAVLIVAWDHERVRRWRAGWSGWDWVGFAVLAVGAAAITTDLLGHASSSYLIATRYHKDRMLDYGAWALGALAIGLGLLPVVGGLAALFRSRGEERTPGFRAFRAVFAASLVGFLLYTAVKAAYLSLVFATRVEERNLIYLAPLFFAATAIWLDRPRLRLAPLAVSAGVVAYVLYAIRDQLQIGVKLYGDALGLAILQMANRELAFTPTDARWTLWIAFAITIALLLAPRLLAPRRLAVGAVSLLAAGLVVAWNVAGEVSAGTASNTISNAFLQNLPRPLDWVDRATGREPTLYLGQRITDPDGLWETEFWNRGIVHVWSTDGTAPPPGPVVTPDLLAPNGRQTTPTDPPVHWVLVDNGVNVVGTLTARRGSMRLYRIHGPLRLENAVFGVYSDGWIGCDRQPCPVAKGGYSQFATPGDRPGTMEVSVGRSGWRGPDKPGKVTVEVGHLRVGADREAHMGEVTQVRHWVVHSGTSKTFMIPTPAPPIHVVVTVAPTFSPSDYGASDTRQLGAQVGFHFLPRR